MLMDHEKIVPFPLSASAKSPLADFVRIGGAHKKMADLYASGRLPATRVVVEASRLKHQKEFIADLRHDGIEVVLDTEVAELAAPQKLRSHCWSAPWGEVSNGQVLGPQFFSAGEASGVIERIAQAAIEYGVNTVLAPTHYLADPHCPGWLTVDRKACVLLRSALDRHGGELIAIDYPVIAPHTLLNDNVFRGEISEIISDLPVDNIWIRASGLGSDAGPQTLRKYLSAMGGFHNIGKPIVADHLGGIPALAALAFGAVSGISHGIGERERFDARSWPKPATPKREEDGFGRANRICISGFGKSLTNKELEVLLSANGSRRYVVCGDRKCCPHGYKDMVERSRAHAAYQALTPIRTLENIPTLSREHYFLSGPMADADRLARAVKQLKPATEKATLLNIDVEKLMRRMHDHSRKLEQLRTTLENIHESRNKEAPRARQIATRMRRGQSIREDKK